MTISQKERDDLYDSDEEIAYVYEDGGEWVWSAGQDCDECVKCNRNLSDDDPILVNYDYARSQALCPKCVGIVV